MVPALRIRLRPTSPWRVGPDSGARDQADPVFHSDALYSAVCSAFARLDGLEEWLAATAAQDSPPAVYFTSAFPFLDETLFAPPPMTLWPPASASSKVRWRSASFLPVNLLPSLLAAETLSEDKWVVDPGSGCLLALDRRGEAVGPFRLLARQQAAVDRLSGTAVLPRRVVCQEFAPGAGLWCAALFRDEEARSLWSPRLQSAFRWLADSGFGGLRSAGFGRSAEPEFTPTTWPYPLLGQLEAPAASHSWWLLSLFAPAAGESIDWHAGAYSTLSRSGRVESPAAWGIEKKSLLMLREGSVVHSSSPPAGAAFNVAPDGCEHPVWRAAFAAAIPLPSREAV
jgi:CRISPR type III-A-associated RAMP protein Csm4